MATSKNSLKDSLIDEVGSRLSRGLQVRRTLPPAGRIHIDRQLPFLFVYRPPGQELDQGIAGFIKGEASYLIAPARARSQRWTTRLVERIAEVMSEAFGGFLIVEIWAEEPNTPDPSLPVPSYRLLVDRGWHESSTVERFAASLRAINVRRRKAEVLVEVSKRQTPPELPPLLSPKRARELSVRTLGLSAQPIHRDPDSGDEFPLLHRTLARQLDIAFRRAAFEFARSETTHRPLHYQALGRRAFVRAVKEVDRDLARVANSFDLLLTVTPFNAEQAFRAFSRSKYGKAPTFRYRPRTADPGLLKRAVWNAKVERIEDPTLERIFREKQRELDLKLTLIAEREQPSFLRTALTLYGEPDADLQSLARTLVEEVRGVSTKRRGAMVEVPEFVARAQAELDRYRSVEPSIESAVEVRPDLVSLMVSSGNVLVGEGMRFAPERVDPLIHHEIGTHVVTYWNGRAQPFRLLATGLANHDELQEGLAVFTEYLVGGLTPARLRTLAGRVLAAGSVVEGAAFIETFRMLRDLGFKARPAYLTAMRVHRGGGFIKDLVYLRGLQKVVEFVKAGGRLDTLLVGKIATEHAPVIEELQRRQVLVAPPLRPTYLDLPDTHYRLERVRDGIDLAQMIDP